MNRPAALASSFPDTSTQPALLTQPAWWLAAAAATALLLGGCRREEPPVAFEPNLVHAMKYQITDELPMQQVSEDAYWITERMFGTPDEPKLPEVVQEDEELASIVSMDHLQQASGPAEAEGRGLFRQHCAICHGVTGNGRGRTAAVLKPYPRDFRMGVFKFKSTPRGTKPTREDLARRIREGIPGTAMKEIPELSEADVQALTDYVIYLSWRGELERQLINDAIFNLDLQGGQRLIDPALENSADEEDQELFEEQWGYAQDYALEIGEAWLEADEEVLQVPEPPADLPVADSQEEFAQLSSGEHAEAVAASVQRGGELFRGKIASCSKCHGEDGRGTGQTTDYDDWTKDWTSRVGLKPEEREALIPLMARGALPPQNAQPRDFTQGVFHGGSRSEDLYRRIMLGIDGTPMPAATFVEGQFEQDEVWHLINFIRSLVKETDEPVTDEKPAPPPAPTV